MLGQAYCCDAHLCQQKEQSTQLYLWPLMAFYAQIHELMSSPLFFLCSHITNRLNGQWLSLVLICIKLYHETQTGYEIVYSVWSLSITWLSLHPDNRWAKYGERTEQVYLLIWSNLAAGFENRGYGSCWIGQSCSILCYNERPSSLLLLS